MKKYALIIHGGCGAVDKFTPAEQKSFLRSLKKVVAAGERLLAKGRSALDVVEVCVKLLENDPIFNAGRGSVLNEAGEVEMDASIMDGRNLKAGAVAGVFSAKNPVAVARRVMEKTAHVLLIGEGVEKFIRGEKMERAKSKYFVMPHRVAQLKNAKKSARAVLDHGMGKLGTVGAVAMDRDGNLAAATSTGGMTNKMAGRTGDSPLIGCGTYADNKSAAVSCTGRGEDFIRTSLAKYVADLVDLKKLKGSTAAKEAIKYFRQRVAGYGGLIMIDKSGNIADAYSTEGLIRAYVKEGQQPVCKLFQ